MDYPAVHPSAQPGVRAAFSGGLGVAHDIVTRTDELAQARIGWEKDWKDLADYCLPTASRGMAFGARYASTFDRLIDQPSTRDASRRRFDSTALTAIDRLSAGMESLVTPQSEKWHGMDIADPLSGKATDDQAAWFEQVRDKLFAVRYEPKAGFITANQKAIRSCVTFGTAVMFCEESFGTAGVDPRTRPILYQHIPLSQALIAVNAQGEPDTLHRRFSMTARQCAQRFGDKISPKTRSLADDPRKQDTLVPLIHAVFPRAERGSMNSGIRNAAFASHYVEEDGRHHIGESGYYEFPYVVYYWLQADDSAYGESPAMLALDDIRGLNVARKSSLTAAQQWIRPPLAVAHDGVMNRPNLNSGAVNFGAVDGNGRLKIQPIITSQNPHVMQDIIEGERNTVRETLYNNLFQVLVKNPEMTATEAMLRANEKGELLGPAGAKMQAGLSRMIDREFGILERKGAFEPGGALEVPQSLQGKSFATKFTSPLDRLRQMKEATGILQAYHAAGEIAAVRGNTDVFDNFDDDAAVRIISEVNGAPKSVMVDADKRDALRDQKARMMQAQQAMALAEQGAKAAKDAVPAATEAVAASQALGGSPNVAPLALAPLPTPGAA